MFGGIASFVPNALRIFSDQPKQETAINEDLEDGEIEDDDEEEIPTEPPEQDTLENIPVQTNIQQTSAVPKFGSPTENKFVQNVEKFEHCNRGGRFDRGMDRRGRHDDRNKRSHLTEAERSVMYLHKLERMEREKRERFKREQVVDDFASDIEKAIASVLKKDQKEKDRSSDEEKIEDKRGKKRKKKDKEKKKSKHRKVESPKAEDMDDSEILNMRGGSPEHKFPTHSKEEIHSPSPNSEDYDSYDSEYSSDPNVRDDKKERKKDHYKRGSKLRNRERRERKYRDRSREKRIEVQNKDAPGLCHYFAQGKCNKGEDCPYSHELVPTLKLELCKFYLMECCAKGDKCLYMHSQFPCKYYHTGLHCYEGDNCKFNHGKALNEGLKQILFKHLETAPKEILGDFPRLTRESAMTMLNQTQKNLEVKYGSDKKDDGNAAKTNIPSLFDITVPVPVELMQKDGDKPKEKMDKQGRNRPSRWQDADPTDVAIAHQEQQKQLQMFGLRGFYSDRDQDMRINSNGDIDMRTLPPQLNTAVPPPQVRMPQNNIMLQPPPPVKSKEQLSELEGERFHPDVTFKKDSLGHNDVDIRNQIGLFNNKDVDIRQMDLDARRINLAKNDVDIRQLGSLQLERSDDDRDTIGDEPSLEIVMEEDSSEQQKTEKHHTTTSSVIADIDSRIIGQAFNTFNNLKDVDNRISNFGSIDNDNDLPANLPKKQRELFLRIQAQQKENVPENQKDGSEDDNDNNDDWYSDDDDDDCRLTIKDDVEDSKPKVEEPEEKPQSMLSPPQIKPVEVMEKLGDLSKIDISAEVTKLLSTISQAGGVSPKETKSIPRDPRIAAQNSDSKSVPSDPRQTRLPSVEGKPKVEKLSIYEQGSLSLENVAKDVDLRNVEKDLDLRSLRDIDLRAVGGRPDVDLRQLNLPFKAIQNYTPATEIDASVNSHVPLTWKVHIVDIPRPDYTGLKLSAQDAQNTGDPRLRKIFRLSVDEKEKESPMSPKESPKAASTIRSDPRRRKMEEKSGDSGQLNYSQQLNMLQTSGFYQSLTSNQKLLLNQELAVRADNSNTNEPVLHGILANLGLVPGPSAVLPNAGANASALNILANISNLNQMGALVSNANLLKQNPSILATQNTNIPNLLGQNSNIMGANPAIMSQNPNFMSQQVNPNILAQNPNVINPMGQPIGPQPGLLGAAPGIPNVTQDFQLNFDPRQGGLLGNAPPFNYPDNSNFNNFNEDYYEGNNFGNASGSGNSNRNDRGFSRDRQHRRGRSFNSRNNNSRSFRSRNRSNRSHTPP